MNKKKQSTALDVSEQKLGTLLSTFTRTTGQRRRSASGRIDASGNEIGIGESVQISSVGSHEKNPVLYVGGDELVTKEEQLRRLKKN